MRGIGAADAAGRAWAFLAGALALVGLPPFAGFFSKDAIIAAALHDHWYGVILWARRARSARSSPACTRSASTSSSSPASRPRSCASTITRTHGKEGPLTMLCPGRRARRARRRRRLDPVLAVLAPADDVARAGRRARSGSPSPRTRRRRSPPSLAVVARARRDRRRLGASTGAVRQRFRACPRSSTRSSTSSTSTRRTTRSSQARRHPRERRCAATSRSRSCSPPAPISAGACSRPAAARAACRPGSCARTSSSSAPAWPIVAVVFMVVR